MANYLTKTKPFGFLDKSGNILPSGEYFYGPWSSIDEAWKEISFDSSGATSKVTWVKRGLKIGILNDDDDTVKEYQLKKEMPTDGYQKSDFEETGGASEPFTPTAADDTIVDYQKLKASLLKGKTANEILDLLLFPEYDAAAGTLPVRQVINNDVLAEVGTSIDNAEWSTKTAAVKCKYINDSGTYKEFTYTFTDGELKTTITGGNTKHIFGTLTRSTAATTYTVTGPAASVLSGGTKLYKSKGTVSTVSALQVGSGDKDVAATSAAITGFYYGGINGAKVTTIKNKADGTISYGGSAYKTAQDILVIADTSATADYVLGTKGTISVDIATPTSGKYTPTISGKQYNSGSNKFETKAELTAALNGITPTTTSTLEFTTTSGDTYTVNRYSYNLSALTNYGKFNIYIKLSK